VDIPDKVMGRFVYVADVRVPGMLHARVIRPPAVGARLLSVDEASIAGVAGARVVRHGDFLAVVAPTEWSAIRASRALQARWTAWEGLPEQARLYEVYRATAIAKDDVTANAGDPAAVLAGAAQRLAATYTWPMHTHGSIGPSCAVADVRDGACTAWSASQATHDLRKQVARMLGFPNEAVRLVYVAGAGCYGRNGHEDATADAALVSKLVGAPVRVQWSREDEHGWDPKGPPVIVELEAGLDAAGGIMAWRSESWCPNHAAGTTPVLAATHAGQGAETAGGVGNMQSNLKPEYAVPNLRTVAHRTDGAPLRPSWVRTPGRMQNCFANESFMDELAHAAGADPVAYRLRFMSDPRAIAVVRAAAERAGWQPRPSPAPPAGGPAARGRGIAYTRYDGVRTYVAAVAEVEVDRASGAIRCTRFVVAHDCGLVVNPDGLRLQLEGCVIQTVSRTLMEEVAFDRSRVTSTDWASYPILGFAGVPQVDCVLLDRPGEPAWAAGEPAASVVPAAIGNAVFDATGARLRAVPFKPARVREAMLDAGVGAG
jgi:nicotinate dehydrogenase subunit B